MSRAITTLMMANDPEIVRLCVEEGPERLRELIALGVDPRHAGFQEVVATVRDGRFLFHVDRAVFPGDTLKVECRYIE